LATSFSLYPPPPLFFIFPLTGQVENLRAFKCPILRCLFRAFLATRSGFRGAFIHSFTAWLPSSLFLFCPPVSPERPLHPLKRFFRPPSGRPEASVSRLKLRWSFPFEGFSSHLPYRTPWRMGLPPSHLYSSLLYGSIFFRSTKHFGVELGAVCSSFFHLNSVLLWKFIITYYSLFLLSSPRARLRRRSTPFPSPFFSE